jgi:hypothetical protein
MMTEIRGVAELPFPPLPGAGQAAGVAGNLFLRPFGVCERDLEVAFRQPVRPLLVTQLLECCTLSSAGVAVAPDFFWQLTVGKQIECLLILVAACGWRELPLTFRCPNPACAQEVEVELPVAELVELQHQADAQEWVNVQSGGEQLALRKPSGQDQLAWLSRHFLTEEEAAEAMIGSLLRRDDERELGWVRLDQVRLAAINQAMEEGDPLVNFNFEIHCAECGQQHRHEIDLAGLALSRLQQSQLRLLHTVHRLAAHYHWSEQEIFAVPHWRRAYYLALVAKDNER